MLNPSLNDGQFLQNNSWIQQDAVSLYTSIVLATRGACAATAEP
jgi:hypothetical protein